MRGHFITFEGGDGSGKTTLIQNLQIVLEKKGYTVLVTHAPGGTDAGKVIRDLLLHPKDPLVKRAELFLFLADRAQQVEKVIRPALSKGKIVLCDRYNDSTIAYQGGARGLDVEEVSKLCTFATNSLQPEITLYLDIDPKIGLDRVKKLQGSKDHIEKEKLSFHENIRKTFHSIAKKNPTRFRILDAMQSKETVLSEALKLIDDYCHAANA